MILHEKRWDIKIYDQLIMVMIKSGSMNFVNVLVRFNQLLQYCCSFPHIQYGHPRSHLSSQRFGKQFFFFIRMRFSPYPVTITIIWPTSDRIPHFLIFKRIANANQENCRQYSSIIFQLTNSATKNLTSKKFMVEPSFSQVGQ